MKENIFENPFNIFEECGIRPYILESERTKNEILQTIANTEIPECDEFTANGLLGYLIGYRLDTFHALTDTDKEIVLKAIEDKYLQN